MSAVSGRRASLLACLPGLLRRRAGRAAHPAKDGECVSREDQPTSLLTPLPHC
jgi:hypothetical protein